MHVYPKNRPELLHASFLCLEVLAIGMTVKHMASVPTGSAYPPAFYAVLVGALISLGVVSLLLEQHQRTASYVGRWTVLLLTVFWMISSAAPQ